MMKRGMAFPGVAAGLALAAAVLVLSCGRGGDGGAVAERNFCPASAAATLAVGEPPRAYYQRLDVPVNGTLQVPLLACDPDTGSSSGLQWLVESPPTLGTISAFSGTYPDAVITYTPLGNVGTDIMWYVVHDEGEYGNTAEILISVNPALNSVVMSGPRSAPENTTLTFTATADWIGQSPTDVTSAASWSEDSPYCSITNGVMTVGDVPSTTTVTVTVSYAAYGSSRSDTLTVTILDSAGAAGVLYVDQFTPAADSVQDGLSWLTAFDHPSKAMAAVTPGTTRVQVAQGTYATADTAAAAPVLTMAPGVDVFGGYNVVAGTELGRSPAVYPTVLDGDWTGDSIGDIPAVVVGASDTTLDGVVVTRANSSTVGFAGYVAVGRTNVTLSNCVIRENLSTSTGGGLYFQNTDNISLINCLIQSNQTGNNGGGVYVFNSTSAVFDSCTFENNSAAAWAGALFASSSSWTATNCDFNGNTADTAAGQGGAVYSTGGPAAITDCTFSGNLAYNAGAANLNAPAGDSITIVSSRFLNNTAQNAGGALNLTGAAGVPVLISRCRFDGNYASFSAGAIYTGTPAVTMENSVVTNNFSGGEAGAVYLAAGAGTLDIRHCSFTGNQGYDGRCLYNAGNPAASLVVTNSVAWGDTAMNGGEIWGSAVVSYSNIEGWGGTGPGLVTGDPAFADSLLALSAGSPCADAGTDLGIVVDYGGNARPAGTGFDIGAWELTVTTFARTHSLPDQLQIRDLHPLPGGGYIIGGTNYKASGSQVDPFAARLDSNGAPVWARFFGGNIGDYGWAVAPVSDGGFVVAGQTSSFGQGSVDMYVTKLDAAGNLVWDQTYGTADQEYSYSVKEAYNGSLILDGYAVAGFRGSPATASPDYHLVRLNTDGSVRWQRYYDAGDRDVTQAMDVTGDGGYILAGYSLSFAGTFDVWVLRLDNAGGIVWQESIGTAASYETVRTVRETADGGFILAGQTLETDAANGDAWVVRLSASGGIVWQKSFGGSGTDEGFDARETAAGGFVVAATSDSFSGASDVWVLRLDAAGGVLWQRLYDGGGQDYADAAAATPDGGFLVGGSTDSFGAGLEGWLLKLNDQGLVGGVCDISTTPAYLTSNTTAAAVPSAGVSGAATLQAGGVSAVFGTPSASGTVVCPGN